MSVTRITEHKLDELQAEYERVAERVKDASGRDMAMPMEAVLLQLPADQKTRLGEGHPFIAAFHTEDHIIAYIAENGTLVQIDYLAARFADQQIKDAAEVRRYADGYDAMREQLRTANAENERLRDQYRKDIELGGI